MSNKTINQALKDLYTGLGGDPQALADNSTCSDYIEDLESAIKGAASGAQIDDETASTTTVYSSSKTEELIGSIEALPSVAVGDIGEALIVESDGEGGAQWGKGAIPQEVVYFECTVDTDKKFKLLNGAKGSDVHAAINSGKLVFLKNSTSGMLYSRCYPQTGGFGIVAYDTFYTQLYYLYVNIVNNSNDTYNGVSLTITTT
jgi:hypothetical protein